MGKRNLGIAVCSVRSRLGIGWSCRARIWMRSVFGAGVLGSKGKRD